MSLGLLRALVNFDVPFELLFDAEEGQEAKVMMSLLEGPLASIGATIKDVYIRPYSLAELREWVQQEREARAEFVDPWARSIRKEKTNV